MAASTDQVEAPPLPESVTSTSTRILYVHVYPSPLFAAHWSFFLPSSADSFIGDRLHATGDRLNGFQYEYIKDYNPKGDSSPPTAYAIGRVSSAVCRGSVNSPDEQSSLLDQTCREVPVPGPSLNRVAHAEKATGQPREIPKRSREVQDCQWWIKQAVAHLVEQGILLQLEGDVDPSTKVAMLPKN